MLLILHVLVHISLVGAFVGLKMFHRYYLILFTKHSGRQLITIYYYKSRTHDLNKILKDLWYKKPQQVLNIVYLLIFNSFIIRLIHNIVSVKHTPPNDKMNRHHLRKAFDMEILWKSIIYMANCTTDPYHMAYTLLICSDGLVQCIFL